MASQPDSDAAGTRTGGGVVSTTNRTATQKAADDDAMTSTPADAAWGWATEHITKAVGSTPSDRMVAAQVIATFAVADAINDLAEVVAATGTQP